MSEPVLQYKKSLFFYVVVFAAVAALAAGFLFLFLHVFNIGTFRQHNAIGAATLFFILFTVAYIYLDFHNFNFTVGTSSIDIHSTSLSRNLNRKISFNELKDVEVQMMSKQLKMQFVDENSFILRFMHTRASGALADTAHLGNPKGTLRELINLRNEIEHRIRRS